jgi:repressor of nif and glnA expression
MNERLQIVEYKGKKILLADLSDLKTEQIVETISLFTEMAISTKINLLVLDTTNTYNNARIKKASLESREKVRAALGEFHTALVGLGNLQKIIATAIDSNQYFAATRKDAYEWLTKKK